ncbi:uncharacterized protein [Clytia hemisphaerica]|uniref:RING-type domain-containing protein n=1 Tax=Clytia hemisphaerica TaxID=252671 RepID=A0A7M5UPE4_9CNID
MSAEKQIQFRREEEEIAKGAKAMEDPERCSICLQPKAPNSPSNKCDQCLDKIHKVPTGFAFKVVEGQEDKEFECPICLCLIKGATELPCEHLMCGECLLHYEKGQTEKAEKEEPKRNPEFLCSVCMTPYKVQDKKFVKSTDRFIQNKIRVHCMQKDCPWIGSIKDYEVHVKKCDYGKIKCPYFELGCLNTFEEQNLPKHNAMNRQIHETLLLNVLNVLAKERLENRTLFENQNKTIERLEERMDKLEVENKDLMNKYETQSNLLIKNTEEIESLKSENANLNQMLQQQNDNVLNIHQKLQLLEKENPKDIEKTLKTLKEQRKDIENLKTFSKTVGELHGTLSDANVKEKALTFLYLYDKDYIENEDVKQWNDFVQQINTNEDFNGDCDYLQQMKNVVNGYQVTVYSKSWGIRLFQFALAIDHGVIINKHIKLCPQYIVKYISVINHNTYQDFNKTTRDMKWTKHSGGVASYLSFHQGSRCLNVAVMLPSCYKNVYILHWDEEDKKLKIPLNRTIVSLNGDKRHSGHFVMLQIEE